MRPTNLGPQIILGIVAFFVCLMLQVAGYADDQVVPRQALTLRGHWAVEVATADPVKGVTWVVESEGPIDGGAFIQVRAYPAKDVAGCTGRKDVSGACKRIRITAEKPADKVAAFAVQFPGRTFAVTAPAGTAMAELLLNEISLNDYGAMALQLVVAGASNQAFGAVSLRTHDQEITPVATAAMSSDGRVIRDGDSIEKGWYFLFFGTADRVDVVQDPTDLLSLCGFFPGGDIECAASNAMHFRVTKRGEYLFVAWNKRLQASIVRMRGV